MARYKFVVFSDAIKGKAAEYENWYLNKHIPQVLNIPGFISGQQHRLCSQVTTGLPPVGPAYMAVYEIETDDPQAVMSEMGARIGSGALEPPTDIDGATIRATFMEPIGKLLTR